MSIDIDRLSEEELVALNHRIVARLKLLREMRSHQAMLEFRVGERVAFQPPERGTVFGMLTRYNRKSVTVITDGGEHWTVAPQLLRKVAQPGSAPAQAEQQEIIELEPRPQSGRRT
jgi:hypothetical protein